MLKRPGLFGYIMFKSLLEICRKAAILFHSAAIEEYLKHELKSALPYALCREDILWLEVTTQKHKTIKSLSYLFDERGSSLRYIQLPFKEIFRLELRPVENCNTITYRRGSALASLAAPLQ